MLGHTKVRRTRKNNRENLSKEFKKIFIDNHVYSVPYDIVKQLVHDLKPHKIHSDITETELDALTLESIRVNNTLPDWAIYLRGLRYREDLTQVEFALAIEITQSNLSAMENGKRAIGKELAQRIAKKFNSNYRYFL